MAQMMGGNTVINNENVQGTFCARESARINEAFITRTVVREFLSFFVIVMFYLIEFF